MVIRAIRINTFVNIKEFTIFLKNKGFTTMRATKFRRMINPIVAAKISRTNFAQELTTTTSVIVDIVMRGITARTMNIFRNRMFTTRINRLKRLIVFFNILVKKFLIIFLFRNFD